MRKELADFLSVSRERTKNLKLFFDAARHETPVKQGRSGFLLSDEGSIVISKLRLKRSA